MNLIVHFLVSSRKKWLINILIILSLISNPGIFPKTQFDNEDTYIRIVQDISLINSVNLSQFDKDPIRLRNCDFYLANIDTLKVACKSHLFLTFLTFPLVNPTLAFLRDLFVRAP